MSETVGYVILLNGELCCLKKNPSGENELCPRNKSAHFFYHREQATDLVRQSRLSFEKAGCQVPLEYEIVSLGAPLPNVDLLEKKIYTTRVRLAKLKADLEVAQRTPLTSEQEPVEK